MGWVSVCKVSYVKPDFPFSAQVDDKRIGIYIIDEEYFAMEDVCPHANALLSQGFMDGETVECPLHGALFDIRTGQCLREPGERDLNTYPVRIRGDQIEVNLAVE
ncbi:non-heme iron oxygenase ferredoxin subunit [Yersinia kristensenii]|uniref:non-heme iron oxygenase ferredoxin subunit n=1 Tax=Yersinia kristensenii TaxID=28152 RepID=UPI0005E761BE|nr:non-heme iron oxygenase ferredoxin subunit [Yersinia kristensenii]MDA5472955.1 non-heme iron oxygenase ferredoxin subunit [Yersinia kristensenii]MDA5479017.1 non-heme iron oxygenase ferredoxin subunit [Yersinia kristensenii]MDA5507762.1 non-heme iron oxygenase ferredoxin subunit [Yersinia kristensenii]MDA5524427.1 non-heme iron oxygenase ferredoxin subunit [Yersinia kristensenii]MDR4895690.1 non-heme iron oxygenase ferredoxin subunit [Yersinia kristensenii]